MTPGKILHVAGVSFPYRNNRFFSSRYGPGGQEAEIGKRESKTKSQNGHLAPSELPCSGNLCFPLMFTDTQVTDY